MMFFSFIRAITYGNNLDVNGGQPVFIKPELFGCPRRNIQKPTGDEWTTVIDANFGGR
jgi:hypothetical protein